MSVEKRDLKYWVAYRNYDLRRDALGYRDPVLPVEVGIVHAALRWSMRPGAREPEFITGDPWSAVCSLPVRVIMPQVFNAADPDACADCAAQIAAGYEPPRMLHAYPCSSVVWPTVPGFSQAVACSLPSGHRGRHRGEGATWDRGESDFAPGHYSVGDGE